MGCDTLDKNFNLSIRNVLISPLWCIKTLFLFNNFAIVGPSLIFFIIIFFSLSKTFDHEKHLHSNCTFGCQEFEFFIGLKKCQELLNHFVFSPSTAPRRKYYKKFNESAPSALDELCLRTYGTRNALQYVIFKK